MIEQVFDHQGLSRHFARRLAGFGVSVAQCESLFEDPVCEPRVYARGAVLAEHQSQGPQIVVAGWACTTTLEAGRRQIFGFILPGDVLGSFWRLPEFSFWRFNALTAVAAIPASVLLATDDRGKALHPEVLKAARRAEDHAQHRVVDHLVRLGFRDAYAGLAHLLLELHDRLERVGLAREGAFELPVGQRALAQAMGFSVAHTNHTLQRMTADGLFSVCGRTIVLLQPDRMAALAEFTARDPELTASTASDMDRARH